MDCLFGLVGDGFALLVADSSAINNIVVQKTDLDKIMVLDSHKLLGSTGSSGDRVQFSEYIQKNIHLYQYRNGTPISMAGAANFTRLELAKALRSAGAYQTNLMLAGWDEDAGPSLYYLDYLASLVKLEKGGLGYGAYFILSILDKHYKAGMALDDALRLVDVCIAEIRARLIVAPPNFVIKIVDKDGARELSWRRTVTDAGPPPAPPTPPEPAAEPVSAAG